MARGYGTGLVWGLVATGAALVMVSLLSPPPVSSGLDPATAPPVEARVVEPAEATVSESAAAAAQAAADKEAAAAAAKDAADRAAEETAAMEAADEAAAKEEADKATAEAAATDAADKAAEETAAKEAADEAAAKAAADKAAADKAAAEAAAAKAAAAKAAADKVAADKTAAEAAAAAAARVAAEAAERLRADTATRHKIATETPLVEDPGADPPETPLVAVDGPDEGAALETATVAKAPGSGGDVPSLAGLGAALSEPDAEVAPQPVEAVPAEPEGPRDELSVPGQPAGQDEPQRLPRIAPSADPDLTPGQPGGVAEPALDASPENSPGVAIAERPTVRPTVKPLADKLPSSVRNKSVPGVKVDGLPQIGAAPSAPDPGEPAADLPPIKRFARPFESEGKPLFVILLHDVGGAGMAREDLAKLPFAVSFVIDPLASDAGEALASYRGAGQEVLTLANGIPPGARASDLETTFATLSAILPESVGIVDQDLGGFQDQRPLAALVLPVIAGEGRGLVTYDRGLNAADQIARRDGIPAALIYRRLDGEGENKQKIRRYLDRAAFKAAQEGSVVVIGDTRAETVAAILEWTIEGRAATVSLAPVTAVMGN